MYYYERRAENSREIFAVLRAKKAENMVRTKADGASSSGSRKVVAAAAPRKALGGAGPSTESSPMGKGKYGGGNPVCPRPTPEWQKGIQGFLAGGKSKDKENDDPCEDMVEIAGSSKDDQESDKENQ